MAKICGVPADKIVFDREIGAYQCQCGCGMELSANFLQRLSRYDGREARRWHRSLNGHGKVRVI